MDRDYHTITDEVKHDGRTFHVEIDFFIVPINGDGTPGMDIQEIRFNPLPDSLNCPRCGAACSQYDFIEHPSVYAHDQYYRCKECDLVFVEKDTEVE